MDTLAALLSPSGLTYALAVVGIVALVFRATRLLALWLLAGSGALSLLFSSGHVAAVLIGPLEYAYPVLRAPEQHSEARHIVVLTAWAADDEDMPLSGRLNASAAFRVLHALELYGARPDCRLIVSGSETAARLMGNVLVELGVPQDQLLLETSSRSTAESARNLKAMLGDDAFFLVTSAGHMPRSVAALKRQGLSAAIPAPTDYQFPKNSNRADTSFNPQSLVTSDLAVHEILGMLWYRIRGNA